MAERELRDRAEIHSVGRALELLEMMRRAAPAGVRVTDVAQRLGVDPGTASRLLSTLMAHGYASQTSGRRYTLGVCSLRLATRWIDRLIQLAAAPMTRIADRCGETVYLLQLVGNEAVTLARLAGSRRAMIDVEVGPSYPLWASAAGRALLASVPRVERPALLPAEPFPALTPRTTTTWAKLAGALDQARQDGIYVEEGEIDLSLSCYATPLLHSHRDEKLAVAVSFEASRPESERRVIRQALRREWHDVAWQI